MTTETKHDNKPRHQQAKVQASLDIPLNKLRLPLFFGLVLTTGACGAWMMIDIITTNTMSWLDPIILVLFTICFTWIGTAFWSGIIGFIISLFNRDPLTLKTIVKDRTPIKLTALNHKTAIVMPIYNEDTQRVMAGIEATLLSLAQTEQQEHFDFYLLSDTNNESIVENEIQAWQILKQRLSHLSIQLFYRRRDKNIHRKVGNIADFCQRWGAHYQYMIVLDADSVMSGNSLVKLVSAIESQPSTALIQTIPTPVRQTTLFGRFLQFSAELNSPILAIGNRFWQMKAANYWGHNAIIHIDAFMQHCGLPTLAGTEPFGGEILSHDFVEAALLKRAGWDVQLITEAIGSYEEVPSNIIDYIVRDRRWAQGNIQHLGLLRMAGLHTVSKLHFLFGAFAYISSFIWLIMLALGTSDAVIQAFNSNQFFSHNYQLFPNWHIAKPELIYSLFGLTVALLLTPKLLAMILALIKNPEHFGGRIELIMSTLIEIIIAIIVAPVMMVFHAYFVMSTFAGIKVSWNSQSRSGRGIPWNEAFKRTLLMTLTTIIWGSLSYWYATAFFWWLLPVLIGLVLSAPIIRYSGSFQLGRLFRSLGLFLTPSETLKDPVLITLKKCMHHYKPQDCKAAKIQPTNLALPEEKLRKMPIQRL